MRASWADEHRTQVDGSTQVRSATTSGLVQADDDQTQVDGSTQVSSATTSALAEEDISTQVRSATTTSALVQAPAASRTKRKRRQKGRPNPQDRRKLRIMKGLYVQVPGDLQKVV
eukprot:jgi/Chlat1/9255/Chrsp99S08489